MKKTILPRLICPIAKEEFGLIEFEVTKEQDRHGEDYTRVISGLLISNPSNITYPILKGVPRIIRGAMDLYKEELSRFKNEIEKLNINPISYELKGEYRDLYLPTLKAFQKEWTSHETEGTTWQLSQEERLNTYLEYLGLELKDYSDKLFLDIGAGTGQLICTLAESLNCDIIGVDLALGIERGELMRRGLKNKANVNFIQANLMELPFKEASFDIMHASGVLHHTPNTLTAFNKTEVLTKPGGKYGVWLYNHEETMIPIIPFVKHRAFLLSETTARKITTKLNPNFLYFIITLYSASFHFFYKINTVLRGKKHNQSISDRITSLFDLLAPIYRYKHTPAELMQWFTDKNYTDLFETDQNNTVGFNVTGSKK